MKLWEREIEKRLRKEIGIFNKQFGLMRGRPTTKTIYLMRRFIELYSDRKKDLHKMFIDLEKPYDRILFKVL